MSKVNCDLLIDYFNGNLDKTTEENFEQHLNQCADCQDELTELQDLTGKLPFAVEPVSPPAGMKQRVLSNILSEDASSTEAPEVKEQTDKTEQRSVQKRSKWMNPLLAAALAASLLGNGIAFYNQMNTETADPGEGEEREAIQQMVTLTATEGNDAAGSAALLGEEEEPTLVVQAASLQELQGEEVYQVWVLEDGQPFRAGNFVPNEEGEGTVSFLMDFEQPYNFDTIAITKEPTNTSQTPQGEIILSASL